MLPSKAGNAVSSVFCLSYPQRKKGQNILPHMPLLVLDGLLVSYIFLPENSLPKCVMMIPQGYFTNITSLWDEDITNWTLDSAKVNFTDTTLAYFDLPIFRRLFEQDNSFAKEIYRELARTQRIMGSYSNSLIFLRAKDTLQYVLSLCQESGISYLTHEQLSVLCNLNRTTVTQSMKELLREKEVSS